MKTAFKSQQEAHYESEYDYWSESPHLKHRHLYEMLMTRLSDLIRRMPLPDQPPEVLEIGAGNGAVSERLLALGCDVTGTEMSRHSVATMNERFAGNDRFWAVLDPDGSLESIEDREFDLIIYASVLHHIPDYESAIRESVSDHLRPGGALVSIQDPLWYPRMSPLSLRLTNAFFLSWRLTRGHLLRGVQTRLRRAFRGISEEAPGDVVEYHVVRNGVDEEAIRKLLEPQFESVEILKYWSSQGSPQQKAGERLKLTNTFATFARNYHPPGGTLLKG